MRQRQHRIGGILVNIYQAMAYDVAPYPHKATRGRQCCISEGGDSSPFTTEETQA